MSEQIKAGIKVRRTTTEAALVHVPIDVQEFTEWAGMRPEGAPYAMLVEYIEADLDFPANIRGLATDEGWHVEDVETELPR